MNFKHALVVTASLVAPALAHGYAMGLPMPGLRFDSAAAVAVGTACRSEGPDANVFFGGYRGELLAQLGYVGINLVGSVYPMAERHTCAFRLPFVLEKGYYIDNVDLSIPFVTSKTSRASGEVSARFAIVGLPGITAKAELPFGSTLRNVISSLDIIADFSPSAYCGNSGATEGIMALNLATAGQRDTRTDSLFASFLEDEVIDFSQAILVKRCPR